jgi:4-aminobutyrate--pyruvate transaminase
LLAAVELVADRDSKTPFPAESGLASKLPKMLFDRNIVSFRAGDVIAICPPLSINKDEIDFIVSAIDGALDELESDLGI